MHEKPASMDLDEFVKSTIIQVVQGVHDASIEVGRIDKSAVVNPRSPSRNYAKSDKLRFDVAITVSGRSAADAGAKVKVFSAFEAGGKGEHAREHETMSRVQFEIPIALPSTARDGLEPDGKVRPERGEM